MNHESFRREKRTKINKIFFYTMFTSFLQERVVVLPAVCYASATLVVSF